MSNQIAFATSDGAVSLVKTGPSTVSFTQGETTYPLTNVKRQSQNVVVAEVTVQPFGITPDITVELGDPAIDDLTIVITGALWESGTKGPYQLSPDSYDALVKWFDENFPT